MPIDPKLAQILLETFKTELQELHQSLVDGLLKLEKVKSKKAREETLKDLFRYSHNTKGAAASAAVDSVATIAHRLEDLFTHWRTDNHFPDQE